MCYAGPRFIMPYQGPQSRKLVWTPSPAGLPAGNLLVELMIGGLGLRKLLIY